MLLTKYEWHSGVLEDMDGSPVAAWDQLGLTYEVTPFLMHNPAVTLNGGPASVVIPSIDVLVEALEALPSQTLASVAVEILSPTRGSQPVRELWAYETGDDDALHYAYVSRDGIMEPCHPSQPRAMTRLKRKFALNGFRSRDREGNVLGKPSPIHEDQVAGDQNGPAGDEL